jgi:hypothetical protein
LPSTYPAAVAPDLAGTYPASAYAGGGYVWDEVLEYHIWCHPDAGAEDLDEGSDSYYAFATYTEALAISRETAGAEEPLALVRQHEYIDEPQPGQYLHIRRERVCDWPVEFLRRPRRTDRTIPDFIAPDAPPNRLDILRGLNKRR